MNYIGTSEKSSKITNPGSTRSGCFEFIHDKNKHHIIQNVLKIQSRYEFFKYFKLVFIKTK